MNNLFVKALGSLLYIFVALSAWTFDYWQAWTFLAIFMASLSAIFTYLAKKDPDLLASRIKTNVDRVQRTIVAICFFM